MDVDKNLLANSEEMQRLIRQYGDKAGDFEEVPEELENAAKKKLASKSSAYVSKNSGGKLSKWAAKKRKQKRKMAKESKKKNRKK